MWKGRRLAVLLCACTLGACGGARDTGVVGDAEPDSTDENTDPCAVRECGTFGGRSCGLCEASAVPLGSYDPSSTTYCDEERGLCGGLHESCQDGWCVVPAGSFQAGWDFAATQPFTQPEPHRVRLSHAFRMQQTEVTQAQWLELMETNPSPFPGCGLDCPVSGMTWFDAVTFANRLSARDGLEACYNLVGCDEPARGDHWLVCDRAEFKGLNCHGYRLPTEYEWEHAARAGSPACYSDQQLDYPPGFEHGCILRPDVDANAWYCGNSYVGVVDCVEIGTNHTCAAPHKVGQKRSNRLGLHDMYGNVEEFTTSLWREPGQVDVSAPMSVDPFADETVGRDVGVTGRGGFYAWGAELTCSAQRGPAGTGIMKYSDLAGFFGFRLVQTLVAQ